MMTYTLYIIYSLSERCIIEQFFGRLIMPESCVGGASKAAK